MKEKKDQVVHFKTTKRVKKLLEVIAPQRDETVSSLMHKQAEKVIKANSK